MSPKRKISVTILLILFGLIIISSIGLAVATRKDVSLSPPKLTQIVTQPTQTRPAECVPMPTMEVFGSPTSTPNWPGDPNSISEFTIKPREYSHSTDLSPELDMNEKSVVVIFRCNGDYDRYFFGVNINIYEAASLKPGDVFYSSAPPASLMGVKPEEYDESDNLIGSPELPTSVNTSYPVDTDQIYTVPTPYP
jgi:hypothetical protein